MIKYEIKMTLRNRTCQLLFVVIIIFTFYLSYLAIGNDQFVDEQGKVSKSLLDVRRLVNDKNRWQGDLTPGLIKKIIKKSSTVEKRYPNEQISEGKEEQSYFDILFFANEVFYGESSDEDKLYGKNADDENPFIIEKEKPKLIGRIYDRYRKNLEIKSIKYGESKAKRDFLMRKFRQIKMPPKYEAFEAWENVLHYIEGIIIILLIAGAFLSAEILVREFKNKADPVFFSTLYGNKKGVKKRILAALLFVTVLYWIGIATFSLICFSFMGIGGGQTMLQFDAPYAAYIVNYSHLYLIATICGYIACLFSSSIAMLIASKARGVIAAIVIPIILFFVTPYVERSVGSRNSLIPLLPYNLNEVIKCVRNTYIYQIGGHVFRQIPLILLIYSSIAVLLVPLAYRCYKNTVVNS